MKLYELLKNKNENIKDNKAITGVFLGDSITHGAFNLIDDENENLKHVFDYESVYHHRLKIRLAKDFPLATFNNINAGIAGTSASFGAKRFDRDVAPYSPDFAVVCFGLNDALAGVDAVSVYTDSLREIFSKLKSMNTETIFMTPNMMNTYTIDLNNKVFQSVAKATEKAQNEGIMDVYMKEAVKTCDEEGISVCDCYSEWRKLSEEGKDTTALLANHINHPTREMHKLFAKKLYEMIRA